MNTGIPSFQNTYVCEQCDFPSFDETEETLNLRNLRLDGACRDAFQHVFNAKGADFVPLESVVTVNLPLDFYDQKVWVNHSLRHSEWDCATVEGYWLSHVLEAVDKALENHLVDEELGGGRSCFLELLLTVEQLREERFSHYARPNFPFDRAEPNDLVVVLGS